jgi:hypothetical protein
MACTAKITTTEMESSNEKDHQCYPHLPGPNVILEFTEKRRGDDGKMTERWK